MYGQPQSRPFQQQPPNRYSGGHQSGGYSQPHHRGPPPGVDPQLWQYFSSVDADRSGSISVTELQSALVNGTVLRIMH